MLKHAGRQYPCVVKAQCKAICLDGRIGGLKWLVRYSKTVHSLRRCYKPVPYDYIKRTYHYRKFSHHMGSGLSTFGGDKVDRLYSRAVLTGACTPVLPQLQ